WLMNAGLVDQNGNHVYESEHIRKDGTRFPVLTHATTVRDEANKPLYHAANFQDITDRKQLEESLRRQAEALRQIDQRKDEFLAMLAHELRNPLASLLNAANALRLSGIRDDNVADATDIVERQVKYMVRMVDDLLDVTRISLGKLELRKQRFDLAAAITQAVQTSRPLVEARKHELTIHLPTQPLWLEADRARVEQMLVNLLTNAAKYSDPGGKISITASREEDWAVLRVRDTGVGIPRDMLTRIFGLFTQLDSTRARSGGGLGIGLTLVHRLVKMHGGEVTAHSEGSGRGSEFVLKLPIGNAQQQPGDSEKDRQTNQVPARHILLIEDNADGRVTLQRLLQLLGHRVDIAEDGVRGVAAALANRPQVALIDIGLPTMDGYEVAEKMRAEFGKEIFLVALTGYGQTDDRRRALKAGFDAHVTKPVDITELSALLAALAPVTS
ncbi:MAG TPA: ATP-binding protein, partial [Gemmataceae bacterium]|nr:ATP-binding protein [Gemmataceae bacterium]